MAERLNVVLLKISIIVCQYLLLDDLITNGESFNALINSYVYMYVYIYIKVLYKSN